MITMIKQLVAVSLHQSPLSVLRRALSGLGDLQQASALCGILAAGLAPIMEQDFVWKAMVTGDSPWSYMGLSENVGYP